MKFYLAILTVALLAQVSFAASIQRSKRDDETKKTSYQVMKEVLAFGMPKLANIPGQLPDTPDFNEYKADIKEILEYYETENEDLFCFQKYMNLASLINEFKNKLEEGKSEVAKKVLEIMKSQKDEAMAKKFMSEMEDADDPTTEEALQTC